MNPENVAADAQVVVNALSFRKEFTLSHMNGCVTSPSKEEGVKPDVEHEDEERGVVLFTDAIVSPNAMTFISIDTLFTNVTMVRSRSLDHLAVRADIFSRNDLKQVHHVKLASGSAIDKHCLVSFILGKLEETRVVS